MRRGSRWSRRSTHRGGRKTWTTCRGERRGPRTPTCWRASCPPSWACPTARNSGRRRSSCPASCWARRGVGLAVPVADPAQAGPAAADPRAIAGGPGLLAGVPRRRTSGSQTSRSPPRWPEGKPRSASRQRRRSAVAVAAGGLPGGTDHACRAGPGGPASGPCPVLYYCHPPQPPVVPDLARRPVTREVQPGGGLGQGPARR